jgi:hypothetical protein
MDTDGGAMILHCNHRTQAAKGSDYCFQDVMPGKSMKISAEDMKVYDETIGLEPGGKKVPRDRECSQPRRAERYCSTSQQNGKLAASIGLR